MKPEHTQGSQSESSWTASQSTHAPFAERVVTLSQEAYVQLKWDANYWKEQHQRAIRREEEHKARIEELEAQIRDLRQRVFGRHSEKRGAVSEKPEGSGARRARGQQRHSAGHGRTSVEPLPVEESIVDLAADEKQCPQCGLPLTLFPGTEDSEVIEIEVKAYRRRIRRQRYRTGCHCGVLPGIVTAPAAARLIPKGKLGISVWVEVLLDKFLYARPTHRLLQSWKGLGLQLSQGTITGGLQQIGPLFSPVAAALQARQLQDGHCHADETGWRVFEPIEGKVGSRWYLWIVCSQSAMIYHMNPSRSAAVPLAHFAKVLAETILVCDRYSAYKKAARILGLLLAFCWAHVRRDFLELARDYPPCEAWALVWVERIGMLYHLNHARLAGPADPLRFAQGTEALTAHLHQMIQARDHALADKDLHRAARKVLVSLQNHWSGLTVFVDHPEIPMDNNIAERGLRNEVLGRKSYYGSGSVWAAELAASLFSVLMSLVHCWGINPRRWLQAYLQACANNGQRPPSDLSPFLPWMMDPERLQVLRGPTGPPRENTS